MSTQFLSDLVKYREGLRGQGRESDETNGDGDGDVAARYAADSPEHIGAKTMVFSIDNILRKSTREPQM